MSFPRTVPAAALAAAMAVPGAGFIRNQRVAGTPFFVRVPEAIEYRVHAATAAGMRNSQGAETITASSTPTAAVLAAFETWGGIEGSRVGLARPAPQADGAARPDGVNLITFADSPGNRAIVFGAIAVTRLFSDADGGLTDTDIVFNPEMAFSTTLDPATFDIQGVLTHELGHALGMDHSGSATSTMFATTTRGSKRLRSLAGDDEAFVREAYPRRDALRMGAIEGVVRSASGGAVVGAVVTAFDPARNRMVSAITESDGRFRVPQLEAGSYGLLAEPLDGPADAFQLSFTRRSANASFRTLIHPTMTTVAAGTPDVELRVEEGAPAYNLIGLSTLRPGEQRTRAGAVVERGGTYEVTIDGNGLEDPTITIDSLRVLGTGIEILQAPLRRDRVRFSDGSELPSLLFNVEVADEAPLGVASLALQTANGLAAFTAGFEIVEAETAPVFHAESVVSAASYVSGPVAPGTLISIFGRNMARGAMAGFLDPITGRVADLLADTSVRVNGKPAALLFVSPEQINLQAPMDLVPGQATVAVDRDGVPSTPVLIEAASVAPALFAGPAGGALATLPDGSLNDPGRPARRGRFVLLFGVGAGSVAPALEVGEPAPASPVSQVEARVEVEIGGAPAEVTFAGMAPGYVGLLQINVRVPERAPTGPAVPLLVRVGGTAAPLSALSIE